jgi:hypothetical protein
MPEHENKVSIAVLQTQFDDHIHECGRRYDAQAKVLDDIRESIEAFRSWRNKVTAWALLGLLGVVISLVTYIYLNDLRPKGAAPVASSAHTPFHPNQ